MEIRRRALLAVPFSLLPRAARAEGGVRLLAGDGVAVLAGDGVAVPLALPGAGARLLPGLVLGGVAVSVVRFSLGTMDWGVFATRRGDAVVALALEPLDWRGAGGARMATRVSASGDRVVLRRHSAVPVTATLWRREDWTDYLRWPAPVAPLDARAPVAPLDARARVAPLDARAPVPPVDALAPLGLLDAPVRAPLVGTRQAAVGEWRRRAAGLVAGGGVPDAAGFAAAGLQDEGFSLSVSAQPSMRQPGPSRTMV